MSEAKTKRDSHLRADLLTAAIRCFARTGYHATTLDTIATEAGVSKGAVYWHYRDKSQLFGCVMQEQVGCLIQHVMHSVEAAADPRQKLAAFVASALEFYSDNPEFAVLLGRLRNAPELELGAGVMARIREFYEAARKQVAALIRQAAPETPLSEMQVGILSAWVIASIDGLVLQWVVDPDVINLKNMASVVVETVLRGTIDGACGLWSPSAE